MQIHLNLYSLKLLALVDTGCNILHENCAKLELISSFSCETKFFFSFLFCQSSFSDVKNKTGVCPGAHGSKLAGRQLGP